MPHTYKNRCIYGHMRKEDTDGWVNEWLKP